MFIEIRMQGFIIGRHVPYSKEFVSWHHLGYSGGLDIYSR